MNNQQVRDIAEAAFKARFGDIDIVSINVKPGFDHYDDPMLDVKIIYDAAYEDLRTEGTMSVRSEIVEKVWVGTEDSPGYPYITSSPSPTLGRRRTRPRSDAVALPAIDEATRCERDTTGRGDTARHDGFGSRQSGGGRRGGTVDGVVDTGAVMLMLPEDVVGRLGIAIQREVVVTCADERKETRPVAGPVTVHMRGEQGETREGEKTMEDGTRMIIVAVVMGGGSSCWQVRRLSRAGVGIIAAGASYFWNETATR